MSLHNGRRGSILILSYFVMSMLLGIAIPQTMRTLSSVRLESRYVDNRLLWSITEAGFDYALWFLINERPEFGNTTDSSVGPCVGDLVWGTDATWDCWTPPTQLAGGTYRLRANQSTTNVGGVPQIRKRIQAAATSTFTNHTTVQEMVVDFSLRSGLETSEDVTIGKNATVNGDITSYFPFYNTNLDPDDSSRTNYRDAIDLEPSAVVNGKIVVESPRVVATGQPLSPPPPSTELCCDGGSSVGVHDAITVSIPSVGGGTIWNLAGTVLLADNSNGNGIDTDPDLYSVSDPDVPAWRTAAVPQIQSPVKPITCPSAGAVVLPSSTVKKFCEVGNGSCAAADRLGQPGTDEYGLPTTDYCFDSLFLSQASEAQFEGNRARIFVTDHLSGVLGAYAIKTGQNSKAYSFPPGTVSPTIADAKELFLNIPEYLPGSAYDVWLTTSTQFRGSINAPRSDMKLGESTDTDGAIIDLPGYIKAKSFWLRQGATLTLQLNGGSNRSGFTVRGWRPCQTSTCTP